MPAAARWIGRNLGLILLLGVPVVLLVIFKNRPEIDPLLVSANLHLLFVSGIAAAATVVAVLASRAARRTMRAGPVLLAMGCLIVGILMTGHGLVTPGALGRGSQPDAATLVSSGDGSVDDSSGSVSGGYVGDYGYGADSDTSGAAVDGPSGGGSAVGDGSSASTGPAGGVSMWVARFPWLALLGFAVLMLMASRPATRLHRWIADHPTEVLVATVVLCAVPVGLIVHSPHAIAPAPFSWEDDAYWVVAAVIVSASLVSTVTHWRRWRLGNDLVQFSLSAASAMVIAAVCAYRFGELWRLSWYDYHGYLLAGFSGAVVAISISERRSREVLDTISTAFESDPIVHIATGYPEALRALVRAVEVKDPYTHGHSRRTAELAARLGGRLRIGADDLRALTRGAYLHDIGKIGIPEHILNKPGRLDDGERAEIERHPVIGVEMAKGAESLAETTDVILHHHERWDGTGYPYGLAGADIPFLARITTVADVWDALTTDRPYRSGWSGAEALSHIVAGSGSHFDPRVVDVLIEVAYADLGVRRPAGVGDVAEAMQAVESCHELEPSFN